MTKSKTYGGMKLKKFLSILCLICLLFSCATITAMAAEQGMIKGDSCEAGKGDTVTVVLTLEKNPGIWGTKIRVDYDKDALKLDGVSAGDVFSGKELTYSKETNKKPYVIVATGEKAKNKTTDGVFVTLTFAVSNDAAAGKYTIDIDVVQTINAAGEEVSMSPVDGSITVVNGQETSPDDGEDNKAGDNDDTTKPGDNDGTSKPSDDNDDSTESGDGEGNKPSDDEGNNAPEGESEGNVNADEETNEDSTGTGDNSVLLPFACIMIAALAIFVAMFKRRRS